jgi:hypothetical protein
MSTVMLTVPDAPPALRTSRVRLLASWLFVLPLLAEGVAPAVVKVQVAGLALLAFASVVILQCPVAERAGRRVYLTFTVLSLVVIGYVAFSSWPRDGSTSSYETRAALFAATYTAVAVFAVLFFDERLFERVIWRGATIALSIGVASCVASRVTGHALLVNPAHGSLRMAGTLTEPSAWAPVLPLVLLLALRRRSWFYAALALAGVLLADSPTCILVMAITVPLYFALAGRWRYRAALLIALAVLVPLGTLFVHRASPQSWEASSNPAEVTVGRLLSGIQNVGTDGQAGTNTRFATTTVVLADTRNGDWFRSGAGPAADSTYFPAVYPAGQGSPVAPNALWVSVLFDFGEYGTVLVVALMVIAAWRMRKSPGMTAVLLPFSVASLVNSAVPDYSFVVLGIMLYAFGWARQANMGAVGVDILGSG